LVNHPYISYDLTKEIVEFRQKNGNFSSTYNLVEHKMVPDSLYQKLKHYLLAP
jgi:DNA uptake protein ComE-like DNA-binding protein